MEIDSRPDTDLPDTDLIAALGYLCLGSRLKRLGERLQGGVAQMLAERGLALQPAQLPLLMALHLDGAMTIGDLSTRIGISQPGVSRAFAMLEAQGLVEAESDGRDRRQRTVALTPAGARLIADLAATLFPAVDRAVAALCAAAMPDMLGAIDRVEAGLAATPLNRRIAEAVPGHG